MRVKLKELVAGSSIDLKPAKSGQIVIHNVQFIRDGLVLPQTAHGPSQQTVSVIQGSQAATPCNH